ncbi:MAG: DoxX family protein [Candidatus Kapabacteria bacterium]|jgi:putative oxidoreductase|nr:DoxX family protein [Candidatus Kapabacteria bacterium]
MAIQRNTLIDIFTRPIGIDIALTALRVCLGALLVYHGSLKLFGGLGQMIGAIERRGWPLPHLQALMATYIEFAGGVLLIVGLFTRPVALFNVVLFSIITYVWQGNDGFMQQEKPFLFLMLAIFFCFVGPGKWSVDAFVFRKQQA